jgi:hypothetical protein
MGFSQKYLTKIAEESCSCLENISDTSNPTQINMEMGLCIIDASMPYKKQLLKDYGIDMDLIDQYGEKLGRLVGVKLASVCPNTLVKVTRLTQNKEETQEEVYSNVQIVNGRITKIEQDQFVVFSLKDEMNKISKYYWLYGIESDYDLVSKFMDLLNNEVSITFETLEFFDPKIEVYRQFKVIKELSVEEQEY